MEIEATIIAKGAPNRCKDGRTVMCAIAVSPTHGLMRIYPLSITGHEGVGIWTKAVFVLQKSTTDQRQESFKIIDCRPSGFVTDRIEKRDLLENCVLRSGDQDPIDYQNANKRSIAIVKSVGRVGISLVPRDTASDTIRGNDEDGFALVQAEYPFKPYIEWESIQGKKHRTHLVGQEVYEGMRRNASSPFRIFENMHIGDQDYEHWLVLGNMKDRRNVWVAAHVHRQKKTAQQSIFSNFKTLDGVPKGWPYEIQEEINVKTADQQMQLSFIT